MKNLKHIVALASALALTSPPCEAKADQPNPACEQAIEDVKAKVALVVQNFTDTKDDPTCTMTDLAERPPINIPEGAGSFEIQVAIIDQTVKIPPIYQTICGIREKNALSYTDNQGSVTYYDETDKQVKSVTINLKDNTITINGETLLCDETITKKALSSIREASYSHLKNYRIIDNTQIIITP